MISLGSPLPPPPLLLLLLLLLCGHTVRSHRGFCTKDRCYAIFEETKNFKGAEKRCQDSGGQLLSFEDVAQIQTRLFRSFVLASRSFWLRSADSCSSVSVSADRSVSLVPRSCLDTLDGFLCGSPNMESCLSLRDINAALQVKYTTYSGVDVLDSEEFPMGTFALAVKSGGKYPVSKHVCISSSWLAAPWKCEVLVGGCDHKCEGGVCVCPPGQTLSSNGFTCSSDPCVECQHECQRDGDKHTCKCRKGYRLGHDRKSCVDVDECAEAKPCVSEHEDCINSAGGFQCVCEYGYMRVNGSCKDMRICEQCEQDCNEIDGVFQCTCVKGFMVSPSNHTRCIFNCTDQDCAARCIRTKKEDGSEDEDCFCPDGYIRETVNGTDICTDIDECVHENLCQNCENFNGGYKCSCNEGYMLYGGYKCKLIEREQPGPSSSTEASLSPPVGRIEGLPSYVKMGSILSLAAFAMLCFALLAYVIYWSSKRCSRVQISSFKNHNIDIFYLQQVTSETYKRLSFDKPKNDTQIL